MLIPSGIRKYVNRIGANPCFIFNHKYHFGWQNLVKYVLNLWNIQRSEIINKMKIVVFDIDGTLMHRTVNKLPNKVEDARINGRYIYYRPCLEQLAKYLHNQSQGQSKFIPIMWSSMKGFNAKAVEQLLKKRYNIKFDKFFSQQHCQPDLSKDLNVIAKQYNVAVQEILLVDDSLRKRIGQQNFLQIKYYDGTDEADKDILRVIKELQNIQQNTNGKKLQVPYLNSYEKDHIKSEASKKYSKEAELDSQLKLLVFDLNKTLVAKKKPKQLLQGWQSVTKIKGEHVYLRPNLKVLSLFQDSHKQSHKIKFIIWTIISSKKAAAEYFRFLKDNVKMPFEDIYDESLCIDGTGKDLRRICKMYGGNLQNAILVDDSPYKSVDNQNYLKIQPFLGQHNDQQLIRIAGLLDKFIDCKEDCAIKKLLRKQIQVPQLEIKLPIKQQKPKQHKHTHYKAKQQIQVEEKSNKVQEFDYKVKLFMNQSYKPIKCLVFDINQTLLIRLVKQIQGIKCDKKSGRYFNYLRPNLNFLKQFFNQNPHIKKILWTTITIKNSHYMRQMLEQKNLHFDYMLTQEDLIDTRKDLKVVAELYEMDIDEIALIDDNLDKKNNGQNFVHIRSFDPINQQDDVLVQLSKQLRQIIWKKG